jgi:hypothetical protein
MFMKKAVFFTLGIAAFLIFTHVNVFACSCPTVAGLEEELKWKLKKLHAVFSGEVIEIKEQTSSRDVSVKIKVDRVWKGSVFQELWVMTPDSPGACGVAFESGKSYLVFASRSDQGDLTTGLCLKNKEIVKAEEELKILGAGRKPKKIKNNAAVCRSRLLTRPFREIKFLVKLTRYSKQASFLNTQISFEQFRSE